MTALDDPSERPPLDPGAPSPIPDTGSARDALRQTVFRRVYTGAFLSNIGTWMQNVVLGALAYDLSGSSSFVGIVLFAQLGPFLLFSLVGGLLADALDRRKLLISISASQAVLALLLAAVVRSGDPNRIAVVAVVFVIGIGQSVFGPTYSAVLPDLVGPGNLAGAISLNSTQMNASRVVGPAIGGFLFARYGASVVFVINAATYVFVIGALLSVRLPDVETSGIGEPIRHRLALGFRIARRRRPVGRTLLLMVSFSLVCLPFVGQLPVLAAENLDIQARSAAYGWLYAAFGFGAMLGALSTGTVLARVDKALLVRLGFCGFAVALGVFSWLRDPAPAYAAAAVTGFFYFGTVTSMSTVLQVNLASNERGRVMALWMMAFGGTVPVGNLLAGPLIDATSVTTVVFPGAVLALALAWLADFEPRTSVRAADG